MRMRSIRQTLNLITAFVFILSGCNDSKLTIAGDLRPNVISDVKIKLIRSGLSFDVDTNDHVWPNFNFNYSGLNTDVYALSSNYKLQVYNFEKQVIEKISLPSELVDFIKQERVFLEIFRKNDSSYYFLAGNSILEFNPMARTLKKFKISIPPYQDQQYAITNRNPESFGYPLIVDSNDHVYCSCFLINKKTNTLNKLAKPYPNELCFNLTTLSSKINFFDNPESFRHFDYGFYQQVNRIKIKNSNILTYPTTGNIYVVDSSGNIRLYGGRSKFQVDSIIVPCSFNSKEPISSDSIWSHFTHTDHYGYLVYNPLQKQYYRLYHLKLPKKLENGLYAATEDQKIAIQIFSERFELVHEEILVGFYYSYYLIPYKNGFIINNNGHRWGAKNHEFFYYEVKHIE